MTRRSDGSQGGEPGATLDGWRGCVPELTVTVVLILATCAAVYGYEGAGAAVLALVICAVALLVLLRGLMIASVSPLYQRHETWSAAHSSFTGFWRTSGVVRSATASMLSYDAELRPTLQHLLAARLAERYDVNLYLDPAAARRLLLPGTGHGAMGSRHDERLWYWLDPSRPAQTRQDLRGIPTRTLADIIDRLERL